MTMLDARVPCSRSANKWRSGFERGKLEGSYVPVEKFLMHRLFITGVNKLFNIENNVQNVQIPLSKGGFGK